MTTDQIIKELSIEKSDDSFKAEILSKILSTADLRFARVVDEVMTDDERQEFEDFSKDKGPEDIAKWVEEKYEGIGALYDGIIESIVADLKKRSPQA